MAEICFQILWTFVHVLLTIWCQVLNVLDTLQSYLIAVGVLKRYKSFDVNKLKCLAIVVESEEAGQILKIIELLHWLARIGVKHVCLYDSEGLLKKSKEAIMGKAETKLWKDEPSLAVYFKIENVDINSSGSPDDLDRPTLEFVSSSDGRGAIVKAANALFLKYVESTKNGGEEVPKLTEGLMNDALKAVGQRGPKPDLLLIYGPARSHLGFPAWRMTYTEIEHMGPLRGSNYGSLLKRIYRFTTVKQNYGY